LLVVPIVDNMAKHVGICAAGHRLKKVPFYDGASVVQAVRLQIFPSSSDDIVGVKQDALKFGISLQDGRDQRSITAADIGQKWTALKSYASSMAVVS
jgi:hypothetical protein